MEEPRVLARGQQRIQIEQQQQQQQPQQLDGERGEEEQWVAKVLGCDKALLTVPGGGEGLRDLGETQLSS